MGKRNNVGNTYTDASGKFAEGNPGRPKGARHKATLAVQNLLDGVTEALTQKARHGIRWRHNGPQAMS